MVVEKFRITWKSHQSTVMYLNCPNSLGQDGPHGGLVVKCHTL